MVENTGPDTPAKSRSGGLLVICGTGSDYLKRLANSCRFSPSELVLVSPRPVSLPGPLKDTPIRHIAGVLAATNGKGELITYNFPDLVSLAAPTAALMALLPGLRETERTAVSKIDYESLQAVLQSSPSPLTIWIDLPGEETGILNALAKLGVLDRAQEIALRCGVEAFFAGADDEANVRQRLIERGFAVTAINEDDPDWPELTSHADPQARRIVQLEGELEAVVSSHIEIESKQRATLEELSAATAKGESLRKALDQIRTTQEAHAKTSSEMQATIMARDASLRASEVTIAKLTADLSEARTVADAWAKELVEAQSAISARDADLSEAQTAAEARAKELVEAQAAISARDADLSEARTAAEARAKELVEAQALSHARFTYLNEAKASLATRDAELLESQKQRAALTTELDEARKSHAAKDAALVEARSLAEARRVALEESKTAVAAKDKSLADQKLKLDAEAQRIIELENKLRLAREELRRSEGQITIIKDLLLREVGL